MQCNNHISLIEQKDFECVGSVAKHCDLEKLCIAIGEAQEFDLAELFCDYWQIIIEIWEEINLYQEALKEFEECEEDCVKPEPPENYDLKLNLICGGSFESCGGKIRNHLGVKRILTYYSYGRYILINPYNDSPNGGVVKTNEFTMPISERDLEKKADRYRTMAYESFKKTINFICRNKTELNYEGKCDGCGCGDSGCGKCTKAKGYGFKGSIITKRI